MKVVATLLLLVALALFAQAGFNDAVQQLVRFQDAQSGAFLSNVNSAPSLEATSNALFLSSLYGLGNKINAFQTEQYLQSLRTRDNGFASTPGGATTLEATLQAVSSYVNLGREVPQSNAVAKYVVSLATSDKLFASTVGGRGNIKSTYQAVATLKALDSLSLIPSSVSSELRSVLSKALITSPTGKYFDFTNVPAIKSNYYGTFVWEALNDEVPSADDIAKFVLAQQAPNGAFFADTDRTVASYESTALALATIGLVTPHAENNYFQQVDYDSLANYCRSVPADLAETAHAHRAVAHTEIFSDNFKFIVEYGGADTRGNTILQGTQLRPEIVVRSFSGPSHSNLNVFLKYVIGSEATKTVRMNWDEDNQKYVAPQGIDTSNRLGPVNFEYDIKLNVLGVTPVSFKQSTSKSIGYKINVVPTATHTLTGASINAGEAVSAGTEFEFDVKLANKTHSNIKSGNFDLVFSVLDSSYIPIATEVVHAATNSDVFHFVYSLETADLPTGELVFLFSAKSLTGTSYSNEAISYSFNVPMIATDIRLDNRALALGDHFAVSFVPATYVDLREVVPIASLGQNERQDNRNFFLDLTTTSGEVVRSSLGKYDNGRYDFDFDIPASYDSLGVFELSFRYETANGEQVELENYDSEAEELFEEPLSFTVTADLDAKVLEKPQGTDFFYGNDVVYRFKVQDKNTGAPVALGRNGGVFLTLSHYDETKGKSFVSTQLPAVQKGDELVVNWKVNPNAVSGKGKLLLVAQGPSGDDIPLLVDGKPFASDISIGGDIVEKFEVFSSSDFFSSQTAFIVQFELTCNDVPLRDVQLRAVVYYEGESIKSVPVGVADDLYVASWNSLHLESPSGEYVVKFFREADQQRASDNEENKQKQLRVRQREAELAGEIFDETEFLNSLETVVVEPLFTVTIPHTEVSRGGLPFATQWMVMVPAFFLFLFFDNIKRQYRKGTRN